MTTAQNAESNIRGMEMKTETTKELEEHCYVCNQPLFKSYGRYRVAGQVLCVPCAETPEMKRKRIIEGSGKGFEK